jgi:hypothetical protein
MYWDPSFAFFGLLGGLVMFFGWLLALMAVPWVSSTKLCNFVTTVMKFVFYCCGKKHYKHSSVHHYNSCVPPFFSLIMKKMIRSLLRIPGIKSLNHIAIPTCRCVIQFGEEREWSFPC